MKKTLWLGTSFLLVLALLMLGPELLDLYRLQNFVDTASAAALADGGPWPRLSDACAGCHGANGNSQHDGYPSLAGQPAPYVQTQLRRFANGERANPTMGPLAMTMSDAEILGLADHFARQPVGRNLHVEPDAALREKGRQLVAGSRCAACHGDGLMGRDQFPRLASQGYDYLLAQLDAFATGTRSEPTGAMKNYAAAASPEERQAIASYLASLAP